MKKQLRVVKATILEIVRLRSVQILLLSYIALLLATAFIPYFKLYPEILTKPAVPLHYNIHFGVDSFGEWWRVFMPSIIGVAILIINCIFSIFYWKRERMLSYYMIAIIPVFGVFLLFASIFITLLNMSYD